MILKKILTLGKKQLAPLLCALFITLSFSPVLASENGRNLIPLEATGFDGIMTTNKVQQAIDPNLEKTQDALKDLFSSSNGTQVILIANRILGIVAILWIMIIGTKMAVVSRGNDENMTNYKKQLGWAVLGLGVISAAEFAGYAVFDPTKDLLTGSASGEFRAKTIQIKHFVQYLAFGVALIACVISGFKLMTAATDDETITNEKRFVQAFLIGTGLIFLSEVITRIISFQEQWNQGDGTAAATAGVNEVIGIINFALTFVGWASVFMLVLASLYYVASFGSEDQTQRAKRIIIACVVAIVIILSSYAIINFFVR